MIGRVIKSHGIKGEVAVEVTTDEPEIRYAVGETLHAVQGKTTRELHIDGARPHQGRLLIKFREIPDRTAADSLRGTQFWAEPLEIADDEEAFYDHQLEGLEVWENDVHIGDVSGVVSGPAGTLLEVRLHSGKDVLIPFVYDIVPEVDLDAHKCVITPPEGLLDL